MRSPIPSAGGSAPSISSAGRLELMPDTAAFPCLRLAAGRSRPNAACRAERGNEIAVAQFLDRRLIYGHSAGHRNHDERAPAGRGGHLSLFARWTAGTRIRTEIARAVELKGPHEVIVLTTLGIRSCSMLIFVHELDIFCREARRDPRAEIQPRFNPTIERRGRHGIARALPFGGYVKMVETARKTSSATSMAM